MSSDDDDRELAALALSPRAAPKKKKRGGAGGGLKRLFGKRKKKPVPPSDSPLQQDTEQARLVSEARKSSKKNRKLQRQSAAPGGSTGPAGAPPPLPVKLGRDSLAKCFIVCSVCEARNKPNRQVCVSCARPLERMSASAAAAAEEMLNRELASRKEASQKASDDGLASSSSQLSEDAAGPPADPSKCACIGEGLQDGSQCIPPVEFQVTLRGAHGEDLRWDDDVVSVSVIGPGDIAVAVEKRVKSDSSGATFCYDRTRAGRYTVTLESDGVPLSASPYTLIVLPVPDPSLCIAQGSALENGVFAKTKQCFTVALKDISGVYLESNDAEAVVTVHLGDSRVEAVVDNGDGTFAVSLEYPAPQLWDVTVRVNGEHVANSPFAVQVGKKPSAGDKWKEKFDAEEKERRDLREKERQTEIEQARAAYVEHAKAAVATASEKEAAQLAEEQRQADIARHMEDMRSPRGDQVRAKVMEKLQSKAVDDIYEPVGEGDDQSTGKKWAAKFKAEEDNRIAKREEERRLEIEEAKQEYLEQAEDAKQTAALKEANHLEEEERYRQIKEHQEMVRNRAKEDDEDDEISSTLSSSSDEDSSTFEKSEDEVMSVRTREVVPIDGTRRQPKKRKNRNGGMPDTKGIVLEYDQIQGNVQMYADDPDVDITQIEAYLTPSEFKKVFGMEKFEFYKLPGWRRAQLRKEKSL